MDKHFHFGIKLLELKSTICWLLASYLRYTFLNALIFSFLTCNMEIMLISILGIIIIIYWHKASQCS